MEPETKPEANVEQTVPLLAVANMEASLRFYIDGLGFKMTHNWIDEGRLCWCWIELGGAALMLQEFGKDGHDSWTPEGKAGVGVSIYFICKDTLAIYHDFISRGIKAKKPFVGNAMWVTQVTDPDGYNLFFESRTDAREETEYSG